MVDKVDWLLVSQSRAMLVACALVLVGCRAILCENDVITTTLKNIFDKEVNILKHELRRNNDDYKDRIPEAKQDVAERPAGRGRRFDDGPASDADDETAPDDHAEIDDDMIPVGGGRRDEDIGSGNTQKLVETTKTTNKPKKPVINEAKMNKLRNYFDKYKVMVSKMMANHSDAPVRQTSPAAAAGAGTSPTKGGGSSGKAVMRTSGSGERPVKLASVKPMLNGLGQKVEMRASGLNSKAVGRAGNWVASTQYVPSGNELDMAPARGGLIHSLRNKNRLCFRHVMVPEGPKYDSRGKKYLGEYVPVQARDYLHTNAPVLLLPKCCNCCKKSVLGCS